MWMKKQYTSFYALLKYKRDTRRIDTITLLTTTQCKLLDYFTLMLPSKLSPHRQYNATYPQIYVVHCFLACASWMAKLSIRKGPVKVAQRHRSERYPENPFSSADGRTSTTYFPSDFLFYTKRHKCTRCCHMRCVHHSDTTTRGILGKMYR